jgi:hypothetical protein
MKRLLLRLLPLLAVLALFGESRARAEMVNYSYHWSVTPSPPVFTSGGSIVQMAIQPDGSTSSPNGGTGTITAAKISTSNSGTNDSFHVGYQVKLTLTDTLSNTPGDFTYNGTVAGSLIGNNSSLVSTFSSPVTVTKTLGNFVYAVTITPTLSILGPGSQVSLNAVVKIGPNGVTHTPEPSSLVLGAMALSLGGLLARRRRARARRLAVS